MLVGCQWREATCHLSSTRISPGLLKAMTFIVAMLVTMILLRLGLVCGDTLIRRAINAFHHGLPAAEVTLIDGAESQKSVVGRRLI